MREAALGALMQIKRQLLHSNRDITGSDGLSRTW
jgi:hypothetical protein